MKRIDREQRRCEQRNALVKQTRCNPEALRYLGRTVDPSPGWALNAHGVYDSHIPECFSYVHFTERSGP